MELGPYTLRDDVIPPISVTARLDALVEANGAPRIIETKTTRSDINRDWYWDKLDLDMQCGLYVWATRQAGYDVTDLIYDVTRVPRMRFGREGRKNIIETPAEFRDRVIREVNRKRSDYFARRLFTPDVDLVMSNVHSWVELRNHAVATSSYPMAHNRCQDYGRTCEFKPVCTGKSSINNVKLYEKRTKT
jgi:hypothetical protein